jgi:hypothetical protein
MLSSLAIIEMDYTIVAFPGLEEGNAPALNKRRTHRLCPAGLS